MAQARTRFQDELVRRSWSTEDALLAAFAVHPLDDAHSPNPYLAQAVLERSVPLEQKLGSFPSWTPELRALVGETLRFYRDKALGHGDLHHAQVFGALVGAENGGYAQPESLPQRAFPCPRCDFDEAPNEPFCTKCGTLLNPSIISAPTAGTEYYPPSHPSAVLMPQIRDMTRPGRLVAGAARIMVSLWTFVWALYAVLYAVTGLISLRYGRPGDQIPEMVAETQAFASGAIALLPIVGSVLLIAVIACVAAWMNSILSWARRAGHGSKSTPFSVWTAWLVPVAAPFLVYQIGNRVAQSVDLIRKGSASSALGGAAALSLLVMPALFFTAYVFTSASTPLAALAFVGAALAQALGTSVAGLHASTRR